MKRCLKCGNEAVPDFQEVCIEIGCGGVVFGPVTVVSAPLIPLAPPPDTSEASDIAGPSERLVPEGGGPPEGQPLSGADASGSDDVGFNPNLGGDAEKPPADDRTASQADSSHSRPRHSNKISDDLLGQMQRLLGDVKSTKSTVIVFFGFSRAGKSAFIMRAKDAATGLNFISVKPLNPSPEDSQQRAKGVPLPGTDGITFHYLGRKSESLFLVDIAGEEFLRAITDGFQVADPRFLEYVALADGFVFMLPAAQSLLPDEWDNENAHYADTRGELSRVHLANVANCITEVAVFLQHVAARTKSSKLKTRSRDISLAVREYIDQGGSSVASHHALGLLRQPALVLLSKADAYSKLRQKLALEAGAAAGRDAPSDGEHKAQLEVKQWDQFFDADPLQRLLAHDTGGAGTIVRAIAARFKTYRFDFVTTVDGHNEFPDPGTADIDRNINLRKPHFGVKSNLKWLEREARRAETPWRSAFNPGTGPAMLLRRLIDPEVRRILSDD